MSALRQCSQDDDTSEEASEGWEGPREYLVVTPSEAHAGEPGSESVISVDLALLRSVLERGPGHEPLWRLLQDLLDCTESLAEFSSLQEPHADVLTRLRAYLASDTWRSKVVIICEDGESLGLSYDDVVGAWLGSPAYESGQRLLIVMDADSSGDFLDRLQDDPRNPDLRLAIHGSRRLGGADADGPSFLRQMLTAPQVCLNWCIAVLLGWMLTSERWACIGLCRTKTCRRRMRMVVRSPLTAQPRRTARLERGTSRGCWGASPRTSPRCLLRPWRTPAPRRLHLGMTLHHPCHDPRTPRALRRVPCHDPGTSGASGRVHGRRTPRALAARPARGTSTAFTR
jgi:hypothetical protein